MSQLGLARRRRRRQVGGGWGDLWNKIKDVGSKAIDVAKQTKFISEGLKSFGAPAYAVDAARQLGVARRRRVVRRRQTGGMASLVSYGTAKRKKSTKVTPAKIAAALMGMAKRKKAPARRRRQVGGYRTLVF